MKDDDYTVRNCGHPGDNTFNLLQRLQDCCINYSPALTIAMVGTNDTFNSKNHVPLTDYVKNLKEIITKVKASGSDVLLMTILPAYEPYLLTRHNASFYAPEGAAERRRQTNLAIKNISNETSCYFHDLGNLFEAIGDVGLNKENLLQNEANFGKKDGVHPTAEGYKFIALSVYDFLQSNGLPKKRIVCLGDSITYGDGTIDCKSYPAYLNKLLRQQ